MGTFKNGKIPCYDVVAVHRNRQEEGFKLHILFIKSELWTESVLAEETLLFPRRKIARVIFRYSKGWERSSRSSGLILSISLHVGAKVLNSEFYIGIEKAKLYGFKHIFGNHILFGACNVYPSIALKPSTHCLNLMYLFRALTLLKCHRNCSCQWCGRPMKFPFDQCDSIINWKQHTVDSWIALTKFVESLQGFPVLRPISSDLFWQIGVGLCGNSHAAGKHYWQALGISKDASRNSLTVVTHDESCGGE